MHLYIFQKRHISFRLKKPAPSEDPEREQRELLMKPAPRVRQTKQEQDSQVLRMRPVPAVLQRIVLPNL